MATECEHIEQLDYNDFSDWKVKHVLSRLGSELHLIGAFLHSYGLRLYLHYLHVFFYLKNNVDNLSAYGNIPE